MLRLAPKKFGLCRFLSVFAPIRKKLFFAPRYSITEGLKTKVKNNGCGNKSMAVGVSNDKDNYDYDKMTKNR